MSEVLAVLLNGVRAGTLTRLAGRRLSFAYDEAYRSRPSSTPLSVSLPLVEPRHAEGSVRPWIAGLLPDNPQVVQRWAREFGLTSTDPFVLLGSPVGEDCAGAVQFARLDRLAALESEPGSVAWLSETDVEQRLRTLRTDPTAWLGEEAASRRGTAGQFSLAGRQRKTALLFEDGRWGVPFGRIPTTHILKPPIELLDDVRLYDQEINEHLCLAGARRAGLVTAESRVVAFGEERAIVLTRYDRRRVGGRWVRVHQEDLCQSLGVMPDKKYEADGGPGIRRIARLLRVVMPPDVAEDAVWRFADALAWNWALGGSDAHAKNYSLLLAGENVRLAPLYDITSSLDYWREHDVSIAMKLDDGYRLFAYRDPWPAVAAALSVDEDRIHDRVTSLLARAPDALSDAASEEGLAALGSDLPDRLVRAVAARSEGCLRLMGAR